MTSFAAQAIDCVVIVFEPEALPNASQAESIARVEANCAVMVPEAPIVAVVLAALGLANVIDPELELHDENLYPLFAFADIKREPAFSQTLLPDGAVDPLPDGVTANVIWYWATYVPVTLEAAESMKDPVWVVAPDALPVPEVEDQTYCLVEAVVGTGELKL